MVLLVPVLAGVAVLVGVAEVPVEVSVPFMPLPEVVPDMPAPVLLDPLLEPLLMEPDELVPVDESVVPVELQAARPRLIRPASMTLV